MGFGIVFCIVPFEAAWAAGLCGFSEGRLFGSVQRATCAATCGLLPRRPCCSDQMRATQPRPVTGDLEGAPGWGEDPLLERLAAWFPSYLDEP